MDYERGMQPTEAKHSAREDGEPTLSVESVSKQFVRRSLWRRRRADASAPAALRDVSLRVAPGEMVGILGPNGAGKTTLLRIIATLLHPTTGRVRICGRDAFLEPQRARSLAGLVTCDERSFYWRLTGRQNLRFFAALYGLTKQEFRTRAEELLETTGLADAVDRPYYGYSAGMKQKLAIIRGLLSEPRLVLYDEPTRSLDPLSTQNIRRWIARKRRHSPQQAHVIATNQLEEAEQLCDRVLILNRGSLIAHGTIDEIRHRWQQSSYDEYHIALRDSQGDVAERVSRLSGVFAVERSPGDDGLVTLRLRLSRGGAALSAAMRLLLDGGATIVHCEAQKVGFDDVFCALVLGDPPAAASTPGKGNGG